MTTRAYNIELSDGRTMTMIDLADETDQQNSRAIRMHFGLDRVKTVKRRKPSVKIGDEK